VYIQIFIFINISIAKITGVSEDTGPRAITGAKVQQKPVFNGQLESAVSDIKVHLTLAVAFSITTAISMRMASSDFRHFLSLNKIIRPTSFYTG
jgi:hypothetical protein